MIPITAAQIEAALAGIALPPDHPLTDLEPDPVVEAAIEDVALGGTAAPVLAKKRGGRRLTPAEMARAREEAQRIGADGEEILNGWLAARETGGLIRELDWASQRDAAAPYDFRFKTTEDKPVKMDAKSTTGPFDRTIHISAAEMIEAADDKARYDIARVHSIDEDGARLRVAENIGDFARAVLGGLALPAGVRIDGYSIATAALTWGDEVSIQRPDDEDEN